MMQTSKAVPQETCRSKQLIICNFSFDVSKALREGVKKPTADLFCPHFELKFLELFKRKTFFFSSIFVTLSFNKSFFPKNKFDNSDLWLYVPNKTDRDNSQATCNAKTSPGGGDGLNSITKSNCKFFLDGVNFIVAKGVKISTDHFFPQKNQHQNSAIYDIFKFATKQCKRLLN